MDAISGDLVAKMQGSGPTPQESSRLTSHQISADTSEDNGLRSNRQLPFSNQRMAALALLNGRSRLSRKAGSFLGQCAVDPSPLSEAQLQWLQTLLERAGLPQLAEGGDHD